MIQFDSNTTDGLYCGSSDTCSVPATTRSPFSKVHLHPSSSPQRARVRCFSFFCLHLFIIRLKKLWNSDLRVKAYPNFLHRWRQKNGIPSRAKHNVSTNCGWRRRVKAGIANSLSFKKSREEAEKRRGVSQETPLVFIPPLPILEKRNTFLIKPSTIRNWILTFTLDKTQLSFRPAVLRHPYSAKSRCFFRPSGANVL